uniref:Uncharacterized protein n=1 Tax=Meloidogyne enterolobii TaxID=390850 RepID=A0A6V7XK10_MELEN|nr:unnamed protein product [Meloidogyne enterolobii]
MAPLIRLQLQLLLPATSTTSTAPARRLQLQQLLPAVYNFNSSCQPSTTTPEPTLMTPGPLHGTLMHPRVQQGTLLSTPIL